MIVLLACALAIVVLMLALWAISLLIEDSSIVDIFWGPGFALVAVVAATAGNGGTRAWLLVAMTGAWGLRLGLHIYFRNRGKGEDPRYRRWRARYGSRYGLVSLYKVFLLQGGLMWIVSLPLQTASIGDELWGVGPIEIAGLAVWAVGLAFEAMGDAQLARFKRDPANKGRVLNSGLWRYTRHPNYFGDAVVWWGLGITALGTTWGPAALAGPGLMTFLLVHVSGVALLEKQMSAKPGYVAYVARTSPFIPLPPQREE